MGRGYSRSDALTLTDDTDYTIRIKSYSASDPCYFGLARLVILQSDATKITETQTQVEMGTTEQITATSYTNLTNNAIYYYDSSKFSPAPTTYFEASFRDASPMFEQQINIIDQLYNTASTSYAPTDNSLGLVHWDADDYTGATIYFEALSGNTFFGCDAALYDSAGSVVSGSAVAKGLTRSSAITLVDGTDYTARVKTRSGSDPCNLYAARLIVVQSDATKITETQTQIEIGNNQTGITSTSYAALTDYKIYQYDQDQFSPNPETSGDIEFHASLNIADSGDTIYAELYNNTNSTVVAELSHTGDTNWTLIKGTNVDSDGDWDTTNDDEYLVRVKCSDDNGGGCSGSISNAKLVIGQSDASGVTAVELTHQYINTLNTRTSGGYADLGYTNNFSLDNFGVFPEYYYEATMKTSTGDSWTRLDNDTINSVFTDTIISTDSTSFARVRSSEIGSTLPDYNFRVDTQSASDGTVSISNSWLVMQLSDIPTDGGTGYVELYNKTDSTSVSGSEVTSTTDGWSRVRSSSITLTTGKEYEIRVKQAFVTGAKIIHSQSNAGGITDLETVYQYASYLQSRNGSYGAKAVYNKFNVANHKGGDFAYFFEATMKTSDGTGYARLYKATTGSTGDITGSAVSTTNTSAYERQRSSDVSEYMPYFMENSMDMQLYNASYTVYVPSSRLITQISSLSTAGVETAYAELYNKTDSAVVAGSEISTTNETWTLQRSSSLSLTSGKEYVVRAKSSDGRMLINNAKLILSQSDSNGITDLETMHQYISYVKTRSSSSYLQQFIDNYYNPSNWSGGTFTHYYEASMKTSAGSYYVDLYNDTDNASITGSEMIDNEYLYTRAEWGYYCQYAGNSKSNGYEIKK